MFPVQRKNELMYLTFMIDILLIFILSTQDLNGYDKYLILFIFCLHFYFIKSLYEENQLLLDKIHVIYMFLTSCLFLFVTNIYLVLAFIFTMISMVVFWITDNRCPLGRFESIPSVKDFCEYIDSLHLYYIGVPFILFILLNKLFKFVNLQKILFN